VAENRFLQSPDSTATQSDATTIDLGAPPLTPRTKTLGPLEAASATIKPVMSSSDSKALKGGGLMPPFELQPIVERVSAANGVPMNVVAALAQQESGYRSDAVGVPTKWGKAKGMLQYLDMTAADRGIDPMDPEQALNAAAQDLRKRLDKGYSMEEAVKAHFGGDGRSHWGPKTDAYGKEVLAKAQAIGDEYMGGAGAPALQEGKDATAEGYDLAAIQSELDAKEPGRYKVIDPAEIAAHDAKRAGIASGEGAFASARDAVGGYTAPSPYPVDTQKRIETAVDAMPGAAPLTPKNQALTKAGFAPVPDQPADGFLDATAKTLKNIPGNFKNAAGGLIRSQGEAIDDQSLVSSAADAGVIDRMKDNGDLMMVEKDGVLTPTLRDGKVGDTSAVAAYIRKNAKTLLSPEQVSSFPGLKPNDVTATGNRLSKEANRDKLEVNPDGPLAKYGSMIIGSTAEMVPAILASVVTKNAGTGMAMIGGQVYGQSYDTARTKNLNPQDAASYAMAQAAAEAIPEALPLHVILKPGQNFFKGLFQAGAAESVQEGFTQLIQSGLDKGSIDPNMTWAQAREQIADAMIVGAGAGVALKAGVSGLQRAADKIPRRNREADAAAAGQERVEPTMGDPVPADESAPVEPTIDETGPQTQEPAPAPAQEQPTREAPKGPLQAAAGTVVSDAPAATLPENMPSEPVVVRGEDGELPGTLESYQEDGEGGWTARVVDEEGNAFEFTDKDGVALERPGQAAPGEAETSPPVEAAPAPEVEPSPAQVDEPTAKAVESSPPAEVAPEPVESASVLTGLGVPGLRAKLKEVAVEIKADPKNKDLRERRKSIERAIANHADEAATATEPAAKPAQDDYPAHVRQSHVGIVRNMLLRGVDVSEAAVQQKLKDDGVGKPPKGEAKRIIDELMTDPKMAKAADLARQASEAYGKMHRLERNEKGLRMRGNDPMTPAERVEAAEHSYEWTRLNDEAKQAVGEPGRPDLIEAARKKVEDAKAAATPAPAAEPTQAAPAPAKKSAGLPPVRADMSGLEDLKPAQKGKARKAAWRNAFRDQLGLSEGDQFTMSGDVGYGSAGRTYTMESVDGDGSFYAKAEDGNGTRLSKAELQRARAQGVEFSKVAAPETKAPENAPELAENAPEPAKDASEPVKTAYGAGNKLVSQDRAAELRERLKKKLNGSQLNAGIDPEILAIGTELAVFHIEAGVRKFAEFARTMANDLDQPMDKVRPYLRSWYNGARDMMEDAGHSIEGMDSADTVRSELAKLDAPAAEASPLEQWQSRMEANGAKRITHDGQEWFFYPDSAGTVREDGRQFTHLSSVDRGRQQKNGWNPAQSSDYVDRRGDLGGAPTQTVSTPTGREFEVRSKVVDAADLIVSNNADGSVNAAYPQGLQPRDRTRAASLNQISDLASKLNPKLLGDSPSAVNGSPIVSPENEVESGNGRTLAITQAYSRGLAGDYRAWVEGQGFDTTGMKAPILVRERVTPMTLEERQAYAAESNQGTTLAMSSTEQAAADAARMGDMLHLYAGGDINAAANREFVRAFVGEVAAKADRGGLMDAGGLLSQTGRRRIEAALLHSAYSDDGLVNDLFESADSDIKAIGGALLDVSGPWAQMRQESRQGAISSEVDITPNLLEAVGIVRRARAEGRPVAELVNQNDMFTGALDPVTKDVMRIFYRGDSLSRARSRDKVAGALLAYTQTARATQPGTNLFGDAPVTGADIVRGSNERLEREDGQASQQQDIFASARPDDVDAGQPGRSGQRPQPAPRAEAADEGGQVNATGTRTGVEPDSRDAATGKLDVQDSDANGPDEAGSRTEGAGRLDGGSQGAGQRDQRLPTDGAAAGGESSDQFVPRDDGQFEPTPGAAGSVDAPASRGDSDGRPSVEHERAEAVTQSAPASDASEFVQRLEAQKKADGAPTKWGDKASIDKALPLLLPEQRDDVLKAEIRFANANGMLFTNGTGTGKTASGLGTAKRFINDGKPNGIIVVPSDKIASDWVKFAGMMGIDLVPLADTKSNGGQGPVITSYANFAANDSLAARDWQWVITDESHYLSSNEKGASTGALERLRSITGHHDGFYQWVRDRNRKEYDALNKALADRPTPEQMLNYSPAEQLKFDKAVDDARAKWDAIEKPAAKAWADRWAKQEGLPKVVFLSATPFPYVKNVDYAEGYLFDYEKPADMKRNAKTGAAYNSGNAREQFFMQHFGYRMRYNKLTAPEAGVNSEIMEQNFNQTLKDAGALSGRRLEVPYDYDRKFAMVEDAVGQKIDGGLKFLREEADGKYRKVYDAVMAGFSYQERMYLLEAIKARAAVPIINQHLALGRKVVVFHDYNKGGGFDPFKSSMPDEETRTLAREAYAARPDLFKLKLSGLNSPIDTLTAAFPDALFFNGTVPKKKRRENADAFNDDNGGKSLIVLQSDAGREGVSLHDTTGKHMRVLINLGMPTKPVAATQIEGRTYRTGQASDSPFRYLTTGTAWEAGAFASKIAERASTAENLALGSEARGLKQSFIDAYNNADDLAVGAEDGKGGKEYDRQMSSGQQLSGFEKAKTFYYGQQKNRRRRDQREGVDYYATPEPLGYKMAEWADIKPGDKVLEPSAGHGAIARFFHPLADVTMVEPSYDLSQRAALANGNARIINDTFESLHLTNKFDAIVMNPPYGSGGKTAVEHLTKATKHLREGGRVVALIPTGSLADKRLDTFLESEEAANLHMVGRITMPSSTFERAGTGVATQVVILEKHKELPEHMQFPTFATNIANAENVNEMFDRIEHIDVAQRREPLEPDAPETPPVPETPAGEELVEHQTKKRLLRGVVRKITRQEAEMIDPATFPKNGGFFIREKYLSNALQEGEGSTPAQVADVLLSGPLGKHVRRMMDEGRLTIHADASTLSMDAPGAQGLTDLDRSIHLVASNLTPDAVMPVLLHEMFHSGAEALVGTSQWQVLQKRLGNLRRQFQRSPGAANEFYRQAESRVQSAAREFDLSQETMAEEFGAYAIEHYAQAPATLRRWVDDVTGAIKNFMLTNFGVQLGRVSPSQLHSMAVQAVRSRAPEVEGAGPVEIRYSKKKTSEQFDDLTSEQKEFLDKIGPERLPERLKDRWQQLTDNLGLRIRQAGIDRFAALLRNDQALLGADTLEGSIASSAWVLARMSSSAGGALTAMLNSGRVYLDTAEKVVDIVPGSRGLGSTLRELGSPAEIERFMGWIAANRSKRLLGEGRENLFTPEQIEGGIKMSSGKLADGKNRAMAYRKAWAEFQQHRDDVLGIAEATGIITPEQRATWSNEFYVPFYRVMDEDNIGGPTMSGSGGLSRQQAFKKLKGGKQKLNDLLDNTLLNFHHLLQASLKNQAAAQAMENAEQLGIAEKTTETKRDKKMSTFVMVDGEKQWYDVNDKLTFVAVSAITFPGNNSISMRVMRSFKRFLTNMTTITPQFVVANAIRDTLSAMATSRTSMVPLKTAFVGALTYGDDSKKARMLASGGAFSFGHVYGQNANEIKASLTTTVRGAKLLSDPKLIPNVLVGAWRQYNKATDFAENINRAGIWAHNQDKGKLKAAFEARDLMDFSAHGDAGIVRFFTDVVPFLNARLQGLDKLYRSGGKPAIKTLFGKGTTSDKQAFARFATVAGALTLMSVALYLRNRDDEEYRKLEDWQRDTYWAIRLGENMFFIPKPFEVGSIATMGERLAEQFTDPTVGGEKFAKRFMHMLGDTFSLDLTPQAIKPIYELAKNKNGFTDRPIEDQSMSRLSPSLRSRPETTRLAEASSRGIEATLGLVGAGSAALSPVQIDYLIQGYAGAVGANVVGLADTIWRRAAGEESPAKRWAEYQPIKRFYKDLTEEDNYTRYGTDFYEALKKSDQAYADLQHLVKNGEEERAVALEGKKGDQLAMRQTLNRVQRDMSRINAEMKRIQADKEMSGEAKRLEMDRLRSMRNLMTEEVGKALEEESVKKRAAQ
jgi:hypothetical protein